MWPFKQAITENVGLDVGRSVTTRAGQRAPGALWCVATEKIKELEVIAEMRGVYAIFVRVDRGDVPAVALATKLGVREDGVHLDIKIT